MGIRYQLQTGPFRASQIGDGDPYELSNGHAIQCLPARADHAESNLTGGAALETDPDVEWAGVDVGYSPNEGKLRAADLGLGDRPTGKGWAKKAPRLVVEVAGVGQDEESLQEKIEEFFAAGTEVVWVVRLLGPHRVEVYEPDKPVAIRNADEELTAPGILRNPLPVMAFFKRDASHEVILRNLLQRKGFENLEAVIESGREEGKEEGKEEGRMDGMALSVVTVLEGRNLGVPDVVRERILTCRDADVLRRWLTRAGNVATAEEIFHELA